MTRVFVSYSWAVECDTGVVNELGEQCKKRNIQIIRDNNTLKHGDLIREFMGQLSDGKHIITVFSDAYFKSKWCMYELQTAWQKGNFKDRTHPILVEGCDLQDINYRVGLVSYWNDQHKAAIKNLEGIDPGVVLGEYGHANLYRDIYQNISKLLNFAADRVTIPLEQLRAKNYEQIFDQINSAKQITEAQTFPVNQRETGSMDHSKIKRMQHYEEHLASLEETLHNFELDLIDAYHHAQKSSLKKDIQEKKKQLEIKNSEYAVFLNELVEENLTEDGVTTILKEVETLTAYQGENVTEEMQEKLDIILHEIRDQNNTFQDPGEGSIFRLSITL